MPLSGEIFADRLRDFFVNPATQAFAVQKTKAIAQELFKEYAAYQPVYYSTFAEIKSFCEKIKAVEDAATVMDEIYKFVEKRTFSLNGSSSKLITELLLASYTFHKLSADKTEISKILCTQHPGFLSRLCSLLPIKIENHDVITGDFRIASVAATDFEAEEHQHGNSYGSQDPERTSSVEVETLLTPPLVSKTPPPFLLQAPTQTKYGAGDDMIPSPPRMTIPVKYRFGNFTDEEREALDGIIAAQLRFPGA